jgi:hypothetical protein
MEMILEDYIPISQSFTSKSIIAYSPFDIFYFSINEQARFDVIKSQTCFLSPETGKMIAEGTNSLKVTVKINSSNIYQYKKSLFHIFHGQSIKISTENFPIY